MIASSRAGTMGDRVPLSFLRHAGKFGPLTGLLRWKETAVAMANDEIVAVGFLTQRDLDVLGSGFRRVVPLTRDGAFDDLLAQLDHVRAVPTAHGLKIEAD